MLKNKKINPFVMSAIGASVLFGASTPFEKLFIHNITPIFMAGLLYLSSGIGLAAIRLLRDKKWLASGLKKTEWKWFIGALCTGGILAPILLLEGLKLTSSSNASLLLNMEAVFTAITAWVIFKENADKRIVIGMIFIVIGGVILSIQNGENGTNTILGASLIILACLCWSTDNNFTRKISASDSLYIGSIKGLVAGGINVYIGYLIGSSFPEQSVVYFLIICGFFCYGISLILFIISLRGLGASRAGAYFSLSPFIGAGLALIFFNQRPTFYFWIAAIAMGVGAWLYLTEKHIHEHTHDRTIHSHSHGHNEGHHTHNHDVEFNSSRYHTHIHEHKTIKHSHHHYPDTDHIH